MRIVIVSPVLPLPFGNTDARWLHVVVTELARRGIEVCCISSPEESEAAIDQARASAVQHNYELTVIPFELSESRIQRKAASLRRPFSERARDAALVSAIRREVERGYDILHVEHLFNGWLAKQWPRSVVYVHHLEVVDWTGRKDLTLRERQVLFQMARATRHLLRQLPRVIAATPRIAREAARFRSKPTTVVPIALDTALYGLVQPPSEPIVGLIGSMHWSPSRRAAERLLNLWPRINERTPQARLLIAGHNSVKFLGARFPLTNAQLIGQVEAPEDFFSRISVLVYPTPKGTGVKVKVLESFAYGVPVVSNEEGFEGLEVTSAQGALASTDEQFIEQTTALLQNTTRRDAMRMAARSLVETSYSPAPAIDRLLEAYQRLGLTAP